MALESALDNLKLINAVGMTYAHALFDLNKTQGISREIANELNAIVEMQDQPITGVITLKDIFTNAAISKTEKIACLTRVFKGRVSDLTLNLILVLNAKGRLGYLANVAAAYEQMVREAENYRVVELSSAVPLSQSQIDTIRGALIKKLGGQVDAVTKVDPRHIGGIKVRMADITLDGTIATQLKNIEHDLVEKGRTLARTQADRFLDTSHTGEAE